MLAASTDAFYAAIAALTEERIPESRIRTVATNSGDDHATALARAADAATADHVVLMGDPAIGLTHDWLTRLIGYTSQPDIAGADRSCCAGRTRAALRDRDSRGISLYVHYGSPARAALPVVYNLSAVSGVLATRQTPTGSSAAWTPNSESWR